jgi:hypothetical protein
MTAAKRCSGSPACACAYSWASSIVSNGPTIESGGPWNGPVTTTYRMTTRYGCAAGTGPASRSVVPQTGDGLPVVSVPSVYMTTVGTSAVAVPNLTLTSRLSIERSETTLAQTLLTFHKTHTTPHGNWGQPP